MTSQVLGLVVHGLGLVGHVLDSITADNSKSGLRIFMKFLEGL